MAHRWVKGKGSGPAGVGRGFPVPKAFGVPPAGPRTPAADGSFSRWKAGGSVPERPPWIERGQGGADDRAIERDGDPFGAVHGDAGELEDSGKGHDRPTFGRPASGKGAPLNNPRDIDGGKAAPTATVFGRKVFKGADVGKGVGNAAQETDRVADTHGDQGPHASKAHRAGKAAGWGERAGKDHKGKQGSKGKAGSKGPDMGKGRPAAAAAAAAAASPPWQCNGCGMITGAAVHSCAGCGSGQWSCSDCGAAMESRFPFCGMCGVQRTVDGEALEEGGDIPLEPEPPREVLPVQQQDAAVWDVDPRDSVAVAVRTLMKPVVESGAEDWQEVGKLEPKIRRFLRDAQRGIASFAGGSNFKELVDAYCDKFFESMWTSFGYRKWLEDVDWLEVVDASIKVEFPPDVLDAVSKNDFEVAVLHATDRSYEEARFTNMFWEIIKPFVKFKTKKVQPRIYNAIATGRQRASEGAESRDDFLRNWVVATCRELREQDVADQITKDELTSAFHALVEGRCLPLARIAAEGMPEPKYWYVNDLVAAAHAGNDPPVMPMSDEAVAAVQSGRAEESWYDAQRREEQTPAPEPQPQAERPSRPAWQSSGGGWKPKWFDENAKRNSEEAKQQSWSAGESNRSKRGREGSSWPSNDWSDWGNASKAARHAEAEEPVVDPANGHPLCTQAETCLGSPDSSLIQHKSQSGLGDVYCIDCWENYAAHRPDLEGVPFDPQ
eukprot:TRINITY_DN2661_c0_g3_i1.p1 TRINITY_DN2661_c0_g3~~TRINITY_DN2661_c0_g3_i1.p1  ORF type:complete len:722 (-),score=144.33 TRINITY_DN2661_c0_g3_i1:180-2345(-)